MDSFGMKYIFLNVLFLLLGTEIVLSDKQCDCESLSFLTELVQQEIFQRKLDYMKLRSELRRLSDVRNVVKQTLAGTTTTNDVSGLEKDKPVRVVEQQFGDLEKQLKAKLQSDIDELERRTNETLKINAEQNTFFKQTVTIALKKEKTQRVNFISEIQSLMEDHKDAIVKFQTNAQDFIDNKIEAHVEMSEKFERNISENFKHIKNTISSGLEEHFSKTDQYLASQKFDSELFEKEISNELNKFKAKVSGYVETADNLTTLSITKLLNTLKNSTENINECTADIETIKEVISDITSDTERDKKAIKKLRIEFDNNVAMVDGIFKLIAKKVELGRDCKDILRTIPGAKSGQYKVSLRESNKALAVYCDMETDGGGWTVFQRRINGSTDFFRNYSEYENGFGEISGEFWLGLKNIQELAKQGVTELRLDMASFDGEQMNEIVHDFKLLGPEYTLQLGSNAANSEYKGKYGMLYHKGYGFSTYDHDVDTDSGNCASSWKGAWWYKDCAFVNLNGVHSTSASSSLYHVSLSGFEPLKSTSMMLRRTT